MQSFRHAPSSADRPLHVLLCIADHYEPQWGKPSPEQALERVTSWTEKYPALFGRFTDSDGRPPRHSFFFPIDEYVPGHVDGIAKLCRQGFGEIEIHHHHDGDTAEQLRERLLKFVEVFKNRHGVLPRNKVTGETKYGFVHGNWALNNSRPDGRWCGVNNEIAVLRETGCYADFTLPSAPSPTQTRTINSIYYARGHDHRPKGHDTGVRVGADLLKGGLQTGTLKGELRTDSLMLIQGPLMLNWRNRKRSILPRLENACLQQSQPPTMARLDLWLKARVHIPSRPDWYFVKLHTHGAPENNQKVLLGQPMVDFHQGLADRAERDKNFHYHYVTARELYNLAKAAEAGYAGSVNNARDFELIWP